MNTFDAILSEFRIAGLLVDQAIPDGRLHRVRTRDDKGKQRSGWYVLHAGKLPAAAFGNWRTGDVHKWRGTPDPSLSAAEHAQIDEQIRQARRRELAERAELHARARHEAVRRWQASPLASADHPYLIEKCVGAHGIRQLDNLLLIPLRDEDGHLWSLQTIDAAGDKRFQRGARKRGLYHAIGKLVDDVICIAEGYATAASVHEATGYATAVAFDAGNLESVAVAIHQRHPGLRIVICADDDAATAERIGKNPGITAALQAARAVGGVVAKPPIDTPAHAAP